MILILNKFVLVVFLAISFMYLLYYKCAEDASFLYTDLYDRNLTLINITNFKFVINNNICNVQKVTLVTIIHSAVDNIEARSMIRSDNDLMI